MNKHRKQAIQTIFESFHVIKRKMKNCLSQTTVFQEKITHSQWAVLLVLMDQTSNSRGIKDVANALGITSSAATQMIDELVKKELLLREANENDRRSLSLKFTPKCEEYLAQIKQAHFADLINIFECLTDEELETYAKINSKISKKLTE